MSIAAIKRLIGAIGHIVYNPTLRKKVVVMNKRQYDKHGIGISVDSPQWCVKYKRHGWFKVWHTKRSLLTVGYDINPMHIDQFSDFSRAVEFAKALTENQIDEEMMKDNARLLKIAEQARRETVKIKMQTWEGE